jgi:CBS-domain-containing membrane protein
MMERNDCGCIPVVDSLSGMRPVGTITDRDITIRTIATGSNPVGMCASDIMTTDVATVTQHASVEECFDLMEDREIRRVLVVDERGKCCGIVAQADVVQSAASPVRTNKVIREISESAPSPHRKAASSGRAKVGSGVQSFFNSESLIPLAIGLGTGAALALLLSNKSSTPRTDYGRSNYLGGEEGLLEDANSEPIGIYPDAEEEIEKRRQNLEERVETVRSELDSANGDDEVAGGDRPIGDIGRGAGQG